MLNVIFWSLKRVSFKGCDYAIVSNYGLVKEIEDLTPFYFVLPDAIPEQRTPGVRVRKGDYCTFVGSYAVDEPLQEVLEASRLLKDGLKVYCTGKMPNHVKDLNKARYPGMVFTDFLSDEVYWETLAGSQCILALTTEEDCLQCAGYEALSIGVPLVVSDTQALREYFEDAAVYVRNIPEAIAEGIERAIAGRAQLIEKMRKLERERREQYKKLLSIVQSTVAMQDVA